MAGGTEVRESFSSSGSLAYPGIGMHYDTVDFKEFEGLDRYWYRVELYREKDGAMLTPTYRRERGNWIPFAGNQQCQMERRRMLSLYGEVET